ncbi:CDP-alcohol phosphatidyltransferase family protein [Rhizobium sp. AG855]|uniref:CDP-alcohol phosphatidyltransferase family protein n=1 Tax=Rhizobium sp. AG855 TaxID=2183898 RepID=UPI000E70B837|nr:CDP-alcohol phosphatidyltransferase family protein [Rhizobium sp. AG855]RKE79176.1 phosphatidylglycerophosphate synthase [Rhizobium sp. AG855]
MASEPGRLGEGRQNGAERLSVAPSLLRDTLIILSGLLAGTAVVALALSALRPELGWDFIAWPVLCAAVIFALVLGGLSGHPFDRFGHANLVTAFRASLVSLLGACIFCFDDLAADRTALLALVGVVLFALTLDGFDGYLARRQGQESDFGARFDMEVDALLILILSAAAALLEKAGLWVVMIGLMRYAFVLAARYEPRLNGRLPPSFRRKLVCVLQIVALCLLLVPFVVPPVSTIVALSALLLLSYSFAVDIHYLLRPQVLAP